MKNKELQVFIQKTLTRQQGYDLASKVNEFVEQGGGLKDLIDIFLQIEFEAERGIGKWGNIT